MLPSLLLLNGFPGTGNLTVALALASQIEAAGDTVRVVDNHWIIKPIFGLVAQDVVTPVPSAVWDRVGEVAEAVVRTTEELTPRAWHLIFTAVLDGVTDAGYDPGSRRWQRPADRCSCRCALSAIPRRTPGGSFPPSDVSR